MSSPRVVLITGANRGIGFETARQLASRGLHVIIGARTESAGEAAAQKLRGGSGQVSVLTLDVSASDSIRAAAQRLSTITEHLDVLINNAAIYPDEGTSILTISRQQMDATFHTNTFGPVEVTQAFLPFLQRSKGARVINVSSGYGQLEGLTPRVPSYCLSKLALNGATIMLADALKQHGIAVNAMSPGWVRTEMGGPNATLSVEEGADTAVWLATDAPQSLTGRFIRERQEASW